MEWLSVKLSIINIRVINIYSDVLVYLSFIICPF